MAFSVVIDDLVNGVVLHAAFVLVVMACFLCLPGRTRTVTSITVPATVGWLVLSAVRESLSAGTVAALMVVFGTAIAAGRTASIRAAATVSREALRREAERAISDRLSVEIAWRQSMEETLTRRANVDDLTSLATRRHFHELVDIEISRAQRTSEPLSVLLLDIDHFKTVNDEHGHRAGDQVLIQISGALTGLVRRVDVLGRLGGEEFGVLMPGVGVERAILAAERLRTEVAALVIDLGDDNVTPTVSIGVAEFDPWSESFDDALGRADEALYEAKDAGRNAVRARNRLDTRSPARVRPDNQPLGSLWTR